MRSLIRRIIQWANNSTEAQSLDKIPVVQPSIKGWSNPNALTFTLCKVDGGYFVETSRYNAKKDINEYHLHMITDSDNVGERLHNIVILEALR